MIEQIINIPILQILGIILAAGLAERMGIPIISWVSTLLKTKNGTSNGEIKEIKKQMDIIEENHLYHINNKLDRLTNNSEKILFLLEEIRLELKDRR